MLTNGHATPDEPTRDSTRYDFAVPMHIELYRGPLRRPDRLDAFLVDLSAGGAAIIAGEDSRLKEKKRYRVWVDDHSGIIQIRNLTAVVDNQVRIGAAFSRLGLELQELIVDSLAAARVESAKLRPSSATHQPEHTPALPAATDLTVTDLTTDQ